MTQTRLIATLKASLVLIFLALVTGCATTQTTVDNPDPFESANRVGYSINDSLDNNILKPVAETYADFTPEIVRDGITNFFDNLNYLNVVLNSFLQGKIDQGFSDTLRFLFNSTIGIGGLMDVSTTIGMPSHNEDFGQTLETWGVSEGSYLYIPVAGPNTTGNLPNYVTSVLLNPLTYVTGVVLFPLSAINIINKRANLLEATNIRDEAAIDPYTFTREAYTQQRVYLIHDGNPPVEGYDDIFEGDSADGSDEAGVLQIE